MSRETTVFNWNQLLPARTSAATNHLFPPIHTGKSVLVTGAGGSIGSALVRAIAAGSPKLLILLDHSEQNLYEIETALSLTASVAPILPVVGDAGDRELLSALLAEHRPSLVYHAAAFKHVPLMEANPFAAVQNNALVTWNLTRLAVAHDVGQLLLISTDKAANPRSIMGASKRLAELAILRSRSTRTNCRAIRLGNVLGSHGSVVPLFLRQIARGQNLTVAHRDATRYFLTMDETVNLIFLVASLAAGTGVFLPEMGQPVKIHDLARRLLELTAGENHKNLKIDFTGLRPGDKLTEDLLSRSESLEPTSLPGIQNIVGPEVSAAQIEAAFEQIEARTRDRDLASLLEAVRAIIPEYQPSETLLERAPLAVLKSSQHV